MTSQVAAVSISATRTPRRYSTYSMDRPEDYSGRSNPRRLSANDQQNQSIIDQQNRLNDQNRSTTINGLNGSNRKSQQQQFQQNVELQPKSQVESSPASSPVMESEKLKKEETDLRQHLKFFFMDPVQKWRTRHDYPYKMILQIVKIIAVTTQLILFGDLRMGHVAYLDATSTTLKHLYIKNWDGVRDLNVYPPVVSPYAIYMVENFYDHLEHARKIHFGNKTLDIGNFVAGNLGSQIAPIELCLEKLAKADLRPESGYYDYDINTEAACINLTKEFSDKSIASILENSNHTIDFNELNRAVLKFFLRSVLLMAPFDSPECVNLKVQYVFDNSAHTGQIFVSMDVTVEVADLCKGRINAQVSRIVRESLTALLDVAILFACACSFLLCCRSLYRADNLKKQTQRYFSNHKDKKLSLADELAFLDLWYIMIIINDVCIFTGTIFKLSIEFKEFDSDLFTATGILLGLGTMLVWLGVLRYLSFFSQYNILILTMKKAFPSVMRFMVCAFFIYASFMFCGWIILGPYHFKFRTLMSTSESMFAMLNGDDMFATFFTTPENIPVVKWFGRLYLYVFISLFMYVILSIFISIIIDAFEVIQDRFVNDPQVSDLKTFISQTSPTDGAASVNSDHLLSNVNVHNTGCAPSCVQQLRNVLRKKPSTVSYEQLD